MPSLVTPPMRKGKIPPFHDLGDMQFQEFCRDLLTDLGHYKECRVFGVRGETQLGIDIRCVLPDGGLEVAQCKCYSEYSAAQIEEASDAFLPHVEYWLSKGVRRFILIIACPVEKTKAIDQIDIETKRFDEHGIQYDLWDAVHLRYLLRDLPRVVATHIHPTDYWVKELCGNQFKSAYETKTSYGVNLATSLLADNLNQLSALFTSKASKELEDKRELFRQGKITEVVDWIDTVRANQDEWLAISPGARGSIIRLEAIINIDCFENYLKAEMLLDEAKQIDPDGFDLRARALLTLHQDGPQAALNIINSATDVDSICLQTSLLLQLGRHSEAISLLEPLEAENNAEVLRLLALAYLDDRDLNKAIESITKAKAINDRWESIQIADAVISYFSALSPAAFRESHFVWPVPIGLDLVKSTNEAIHALEHTGDIFKKIAQNEPKRGAFTLSLRIWYAASLACDFRKQNEAEQEFINLIREHPADHRIISWVLSRGYAVGLQRSRQELKRLRKNSFPTLANIVSSVMIDIHERTTRNTLYYIESNKKALIEEENEQLVDYWSIQVLVSRKKLHEARKRIESSKYKRELEPLQLLLIQQEANISKDFQPFVDYLVNSVETHQDALLLLELCHFYALHGQWDCITPYSERLISEIQTVEALKIVSAALYNLQQFMECKEFLEKNKHLCFESALPSELILIYIRCKALSGEFPEALSDLQQLTESNPTKQNLLLLRDFYILKGDTSGLRDIAYLVKKQTDFKPDELIQFASSLLWASPELAKDFLRMAPSEKLSIHQVVEKMLLGFSLGLDSEIKDIHSLIPNILDTEDAPIRMVTLEETIEIMKQKNQQLNELLSKYSVGEIPIHLLSMNLGSNLFTLYKRTLYYNSSVSPNQKFPLYIRYGGRPSLTDFKEPDEPFALNHVSLDITTLLLLDHFSILDIFEKTETPILLPVNTVQALVYMKQVLEQYQPDRVQASKLLLEYFNENRFRKVDVISSQFSSDFDFDRLSNLIYSLGNLQGYVVGFFSQRGTWERLDVNKSNLKFVCLLDVIKSLRTEAVITEVEESTAIDLIGTEGLIRTNSDVPKGSNLFFVANTIHLLAQTGILNHVCAAYSVWAESSEVTEIQSSLREERDRSDFAASLQNLIDRISKGIENKKYVFLPQQKLDEKIEDLAHEDIILRNLFENFIAGQNSSIMPVIDDFYIQKQLHVQGSQVIGVYELVWSAYKQGRIAEAKYYDLLIEFRKADLRYIPISSDEIFFHISRATTENNAVREDSRLRLLKEYISSSLLVGRNLQAPTQPFDSLVGIGEFEYILSLVHSIAYAVMKIWRDDVTEEKKQICSSWIFENLYLDMLTLCSVVGWEREPKDQLFLVALGLAEFFLNGLQFPKDGSNNSPRKQFYGWLYRNICEPRFNANPGLLAKTAEFIKNSLASEISDHTNTDFDPYIRLFSQRLYQDLPSPIKAVMEQDKEFLEQIGIEIITVIDIADIKFAAGYFWNKFAEILKSDSAVIQSVDPKAEIQFNLYSKKGNLAVIFKHPLNGNEITVESEDFAFITNTNLDNWLDINSKYFIEEMSRTEFRSITIQISNASSPAERMELLDKLRKSSIGNYYHNLEEELRTSQVLDFGHLLPPSLQSLRQLFGFDAIRYGNIDAVDLINQIAREQFNNRGLLNAIKRFASLPVEIPPLLVNEIQKLQKDERNVLFLDLSTSLLTPLNRLHLIRLMTLFGYEETAKKLTLSFFEDDANYEISAFLLLLDWVLDSFENLSEHNNYSPEEKLLLTWGHTNELFRILTKVSVPSDWLIKTFKEKRSLLPLNYIFSTPPPGSEDIIYAGRLDFLSFKILGIYYALGESRILPKKEQEILLNEVFPWKENVALPAIGLLEQREAFTNILNSFFGKDISGALFKITSSEDERISTISSSSLRDLASQAIEWLSSLDTAIAGFQFLFPIYHMQEIPEFLFQNFERNISKLNFAELVHKNPIVTYMGFYISTCQAKQISENTREHLISQIMELAVAGSQLPCNEETANGISFSRNEIIGLLFESAIQLAKGLQKDLWIDEFSRLFLEIVSHWKEAIPMGLRLFNRIYQDTPIPTSQKLGKTLLKLRLLR